MYGESSYSAETYSGTAAATSPPPPPPPPPPPATGPWPWFMDNTLAGGMWGSDL